MFSREDSVAAIFIFGRIVHGGSFLFTWKGLPQAYRALHSGVLPWENLNKPPWSPDSLNIMIGLADWHAV